MRLLAMVADRVCISVVANELHLRFMVSESERPQRDVV